MLRAVDEADISSTSDDRVDPQAPNPFASSISRDALLAYTYHLYHSQNSQVPGMTPIPLNCTPPIIDNVEQVCKLQILPLLVILRSLHPQDTSILLLMACTYHALRDFDSSLTLSQEILRLEPNSAEAMCNIGTTMMSIGQHDQAYEWWWRALQVHPLYWDAVDHLLNFLFPLAQQTHNSQHSSTLYARALDVCSFVERKAVASNGRLLLPVPTHQLHRLQKVFFTCATIRMMTTDNISDALRDYFRALELVIYPPTPRSDGDAYTMRELILAIFVAGYLIQSTSDDPVPIEILEILGVPGGSAPIDAIAIAQSGFDVFRAVRASGDRLVTALLNITGNALPFLLLLPEHVARVPMVLFPGSMGVLPGICAQAPNSSHLQMPPDNVRNQANLMTSSVLLALAKRYQDLSSADVAIPGLTGTLNVNYSLSILFYYFALSLSPSPSTYNNMGIILSTMAYVSPHAIHRTKRREFSGPALAKVYYTAGLQMDPSHPHLLTNLGSLHKDEGNLEEAMKLYSKAIYLKPDFDIALVNMGNAVKDTGRSWDALEYYRRAVELNPDLPEAVCGLVNSMASVCDWRWRDSGLNEFSVDAERHALPPNLPNYSHRQGYVKKMIDICENQLQIAYSQNTHAISAAKTLDEWLESLQLVFGRPLRKQELDHWARLFGQFYGPMNRTERQINEGGFIIRFIDWIQPRLQRRWYLKVYGKVFSAHKDTRTDPQSYGNVFLRPALPRSMTPPTVPSVLPFHTFIHPLPARMIRLISHRHALRISFTALSQSWLPRHVYPPPGPAVNGVLNIGYVSNDVNDHPLSHLMQSVFGMHDRKRFKVYLYTTTTWDGTSYRPKISADVEVFVDASQWSTAAIVEHISQNKIHILINLGGYTKGARNDVFAARPCPIQMQLMGYAGTLGAGWCDYLVCDPVSCPQDMCATEVWRRRRSLGNGSISESGTFLDLDADFDPERQTDDFTLSVCTYSLRDAVQD
ncbi:hypothetical protein PHLCEN_2v430 [Hermanssonia centrifuga]|uniref:protein O-GlcNAc transferase n=1 Tax=Hermanssonia centrifuga TaxID=98765 RepID=A0A2R6S624_9APHY|nr:hypothetical protein PHLCEN_2v430 [Hermanssonia centrifuga]